MIKSQHIQLPLFNSAMWSRIIIYSVLILFAADNVYSTLAGIGPENKAQCFLYSGLPRWAFMFYEYFVELILIVIAGIFGGVLLDTYTSKLKRFFPKNQLLAFIYASVLPVCSCGVVPIVDAMKERVRLRTIITFVLSAPLLNPYIVFLSFTALGYEYMVIRIIASFALAVISGYVVEKLANLFHLSIPGVYDNCGTKNCHVFKKDPFVKTMQYTQKMLPYILIAGSLTLFFEWSNPKQYLETLSFSNEPFAMATMVLAGIPIYVCNGSDVIFLKPLMSFTDLSLASAMIFSLTSTSVCISSIVMMAKFFGKKLTALLIGVLVGVVVLLGITLNLAI